MRGYLGFFIGFCLLMVLAGCVISSSPDPSQTLVMYPGDTKTFSIKATQYTVGFIPPWGMTEIIWYADDDYQKFDWIESSFDYTAPASPGRHEVRVEVGLSQICVDCPSPLDDFVSQQSITWNIDVCGIIPQPVDATLAMNTSMTQIFAVTAWPEDSSYSYAWYLDDTIQTGCSGSEYTYAPKISDDGEHILRVEVSGWENGATFAQSWSIVVS